MDNAFELAMSATVLPGIDEIDPARFLPSSRSVAFRKSVWAVAGGYPPWLDYCEDLVFDFAVQARGGFVFAPRARVRFRPRASLAAFFRQYYRYARGDGKADLWRRRHAVRYATYLVALPTIAWLARRDPFWYALLLLGAAIYLAQPYRRLARLAAAGGWSRRETLAAGLWIPLVRVWGDLAKMLGYPAGLRWRATAGRSPGGWEEAGKRLGDAA
jgi:hypothetical protein